MTPTKAQILFLLVGIVLVILLGTATKGDLIGKDIQECSSDKIWRNINNACYTIHDTLDITSIKLYLCGSTMMMFLALATIASGIDNKEVEEDERQIQ